MYEGHGAGGGGYIVHTQIGPLNRYHRLQRAIRTGSPILCTATQLLTTCRAQRVTAPNTMRETVDVPCVQLRFVDPNPK